MDLLLNKLAAIAIVIASSVIAIVIASSVIAIVIVCSAIAIVIATSIAPVFNLHGGINQLDTMQRPVMTSTFKRPPSTGTVIYFRPDISRRESENTGA